MKNNLMTAPWAQGGTAPVPAFLVNCLFAAFLLVSYFGLGVSEVIFCSVTACLLVFLLMGLCLNPKEEDGK
jgi:hypothetical protein